MVNEGEIEPDYFIDRPPEAMYMPIPRGDDKTTQVLDRIDPDLFDFELEVEPVLQVLVGKSLEHARIEVIEEDEAQQLAKAKAVYKQKKEASLVETQRLEAARKRRDEELDRRNLQEQLQHKLAVWREKKEYARNAALKYLKFLKRDKMEELKDQGLLRSQ